MTELIKYSWVFLLTIAICLESVASNEFTTTVTIKFSTHNHCIINSFGKNDESVLFATQDNLSYSTRLNYPLNNLDKISIHGSNNIVIEYIKINNVSLTPEEVVHYFDLMPNIKIKIIDHQLHLPSISNIVLVAKSSLFDLFSNNETNTLIRAKFNVSVSENANFNVLLAQTSKAIKYELNPSDSIIEFNFPINTKTKGPRFIISSSIENYWCIKSLVLQSGEKVLVINGFDLLNATYWQNQFDRRSIREYDQSSFCFDFEEFNNNQSRTYFQFNSYALNNFYNWSIYDMIGTVGIHLMDKSYFENLHFLNTSHNDGIQNEYYIRYPIIKNYYRFNIYGVIRDRQEITTSLWFDINELQEVTINSIDIHINDIEYKLDGERILNYFNPVNYTEINMFDPIKVTFRKMHSSTEFIKYKPGITTSTILISDSRRIQKNILLVIIASLSLIGLYILNKNILKRQIGSVR